jgi:hypothetical protein
LAGAASGALRVGVARCMPEEPPPPRRLASLIEGAMPAAKTATDRAKIRDFIATSF